MPAIREEKPTDLPCPVCGRVRTRATSPHIPGLVVYWCDHCFKASIPDGLAEGFYTKPDEPPTPDDSPA